VRRADNCLNLSGTIILIFRGKQLSLYVILLAHDYLSIDVRVIWEVLYDDLPVLRRKVEAILE